MHIAVTGATGHLGANLVRILVEQEHRVTALYHRPERLAALDGLDVICVQADVLNIATLHRAFADIDAVIHLAAIISIDGDPDGSVLRTNVTGTRNVAEACLSQGVGRLVHASSIHAFKIRKSDQHVDENHMPADVTCFSYDYSKALGEREILAAVGKGLDAVIINPTGIIGPYDFEPSRAGIMLRNIFTGRMRVLIEGGFDWVDARDVSRAACNAIERGGTGERYILSGHWVSFADLAATCDRIANRLVTRCAVPITAVKLGLPFFRLTSRTFGKKPLFTEESLHIVEHGCKACSCAKAKRELGFKVRPFDETLTDVYDWLRSMS